MFISVRKYKVTGSIEELAHQVEQGFVPIVRHMPGFRGYHFLDCGDNIVATISMFDSREAAFASNDKARMWVQEHLAKFSPTPPEITAGKSLIDA